MNYTHMNHIETDHIMTFQNPSDPLDIPHVLVSEDYKLELARMDKFREEHPTQYKGRNPIAEDIDRECNEAEDANRWYR